MDQDYKYVGLWSPHIKTLLQMTTSCDNHDILVEVLVITMIYIGLCSFSVFCVLRLCFIFTDGYLLFSCWAYLRI